MAGLRERKKEQTRQRIAATALRLFGERGFDAVTVNEIAEAAEVAKATLFAYFPTKESLVLDGVGEEDLAGIVADRPRDKTPLDALRAHYRAATTEERLTALEREALIARIGVIFDTPALGGAANSLLYRQRQSLARVLAEEHGETAAALMAAQIAASLLTLQESFFHRLADGASPQDVAPLLAADVELAFDLLENGLDQAKGK
jgi:AcrR family transcriptional regulator